MVKGWLPACVFMHAFRLCLGGLLSLQPPASFPPPVSLSSCVSFAHCARLPVTTAIEYIFDAKKTLAPASACQ